jgi:hypothetical protein
MNKMIKGLLVTVLAVSAAQVYATNTNRTFLMPRPTGVDLPMEYTTFESLIGRKAEDKFGGNFQVTGFYKDSNNAKELAKLFLINNKSTIALTQIVTSNNLPTTAVDVDLRYLIHDTEANTYVETAAVGANLSLKPEIDSYGVRFDYHQDLDKILKGLYLKANLPVACVETNPKINVTNTTGFAPVYANGDSVLTTVTSYFNGSYSNTTEAGFEQIALTKGLISGKHNETGVADIDIALGYKFLNKHNYYASLALAITIPTGNNAKGVYMFEPIVGNGQHFGLGGDLDAQARVWGDCEHNLKINLFMKYRYLFESHEHRTLQINGRPFSQYFLLGVSGQIPATPAANILTQNVDVTPGSQFDGILGLAYNNGGFAFDLGYNLYFRESEKVHYKGGFDTTKYNVMSKNWQQTAVFDATNTAVNDVDQVLNGVTVAPLTVANLSLTAPATPSQFTNGIYSGLGYYFKEWETPLMLGLSGKYEFASNNASIEQWTIAGKIGIGF